VRFANNEVFVPRGIALEVYTCAGPERALQAYVSFFRRPRSEKTHPMEAGRFMMPVGGFYSCIESIKPHLVSIVQPWAQVLDDECWVAAYVPVYGTDGKIVAELNTRDLQDEMDGKTSGVRRSVVVPFRSRNDRDGKEGKDGPHGSRPGHGDGEDPTVPPDKPHRA